GGGVLEAGGVDQREEALAVDADRVGARLLGRPRLLADRDGLLLGERRDDARLALVHAADDDELGGAHPSASTRQRRPRSCRFHRSRIRASRGSSPPFGEGLNRPRTTSRSGGRLWKRRRWPLVGSSQAERMTTSGASGDADAVQPNFSRIARSTASRGSGSSTTISHELPGGGSAGSGDVGPSAGAGGAAVEPSELVVTSGSFIQSTSRRNSSLRIGVSRRMARTRNSARVRTIIRGRKP